MDDPAKLKVFVSYSRTDMAVADRLVGHLESKNFELLIDRRDLPYGEKWKDELSHFIRQADAIVFIVSPASIRSAWCMWEVDQVTALSKRLVPVVAESVPPDKLPDAIADINLLPLDVATAFDRQVELLAKVLGTDWQWLKGHTRLNWQAADWLKRGRPPSFRLQGPQLREALAWLKQAPPHGPPVPAHVREYLEDSQASEVFTSPWYTAKVEYRAMDIPIFCKRCDYSGEFTPAAGERPPKACPRCGLDV